MTKKTENEYAVAPCPFCGGEVGIFESNDTIKLVHDGQCFFEDLEEYYERLHDGSLDNFLRLWNQRAFVAEPDKQAAYMSLVQMGAAYVNMVEGCAQTISKKKAAGLQAVFISASVEFLNHHAGTVRSALNSLENSKPTKKKS